MIPFELAEPTSLADAVKLLDPDDATVRPIAGGTALMLMMKAGVFRPEKLVSLRKIETQVFRHRRGRRRASHRRDDDAVGARTLRRRAQARAGHHPHLLTLSNVRVRNVATVGGALAHGDPHMDLPPVLMALGATHHDHRAQGRAQARGRGSVLRLLRDRAGEERTDRRGARSGAGRQDAAYMKVTTGSADDWPALGVAAVIEATARSHQVGPHRRQRRDRQGDAAEVGGSRAQRQDASTTSCSRRPATPRPRRPSSSPTCAARCPTSAN